MSQSTLSKTFCSFTAAVCMMTGGAALAQTTAAPARAMGSISVDAMGNQIKISALADPKVEGVTCHFTNFERGTASRIWGIVDGRNPFEDPSNSSIACRQTKPTIVIGDIKDGDDIFTQKASLIFKNLAVKRFYDCETNTLVYVSHSRQVIEGSAKAVASSVPLFAANVTWKNGAPTCNK